MLRLDSLNKRFGATVAVADLSLEVGPGEFLTLLGPSGCGKTTTLRMIAGFESPSAGRILLDDRDVTGLSPQRRGFGMVFQNYALFPHLDVFENVAFGLKTRGVARAALAARVEEALALVDLAGYAKRRVQELSGGQQQRVALARALAPEPRVLLLDEPLSNLDAALRERTRTELRALLKRVGITAIFVTHDQEEAFALSDRIAVMEGGRLQQVGTPETLYQRPANAFVASFLGRANFLEARLVAEEAGTLICELPGGVRWRVPAAAESTTEPEDPATAGAMRPERGASAGSPAPVEGMALAGDGASTEGADRSAAGTDGISAVGTTGDRVRIMVRPEALRLVSGPEDGVLEGVVVERRFAGPVTHYRVRIDDAELLVHGAAADAAVGDRVYMRAGDNALAIAATRA